MGMNRNMKKFIFVFVILKILDMCLCAIPMGSLIHYGCAGNPREEYLPIIIPSPVQVYIAKPRDSNRTSISGEECRNIAPISVPGSTEKLRPITCLNGRAIYFVTNSSCWVQTSRQYFTKLEVYGNEHPEGDWGIPLFCPENHFVTGLSLRYREFQGRGVDDYGVISVVLYCTLHPGAYFGVSEDKVDDLRDYAASIRTEFLREAGLEGVRNTENQKLFCSKSFVNGFDVRMLKSQGVYDDLGITNVGIRCMDGQTLQHTLHFDPDGEKARMVDSDTCPKQTAACGLQEKYEGDHHNDNTGLNDIKFFCCKLPEHKGDEATTCRDAAFWRVVGELQNNGKTTHEMTYTLEVGVSRTTGKRNLDSNIETDTRQTEYDIEASATYGVSEFQKAELKARFGQKFGREMTTTSERETSVSDVFSKGHSMQQKVDVGPKNIVKILQKVVTCGSFEMKTLTLRREDDCMDGFEGISCSPVRTHRISTSTETLDYSKTSENPEKLTSNGDETTIIISSRMILYISVGIAIGVLLLMGLIILFLYKRRSTSRSVAAVGPEQVEL